MRITFFAASLSLLLISNAQAEANVVEEISRLCEHLHPDDLNQQDACNEDQELAVFHLDAQSQVFKAQGGSQKLLSKSLIDCKRKAISKALKLVDYVKLDSCVAEKLGSAKK
ncbi:hypothetical protein [Aestuariivirga sp.]|uniref:hypothetical protein n=1 Tax=Aestuariivirga sp. TaxID=2650926 RepID=UPI00391C26C3